MLILNFKIMKLFILLILAVSSVRTSLFSQDLISLLSPYDKDTIETVYPVFNWYYLNNLQNRSDIKYTFTLVDLKKDQSAQAGISVNVPLVKINDIKGYQFAYPFDAPKLEYNHRYGWRIEKKVNGIVVSSSDAWEFILYKEIKLPNKYVVLDIVPGSSIYKVDHEIGLYFKLNSIYGNDKLKFYVENDRNELEKAQLAEDQKKGIEEELIKTNSSLHYLPTDNFQPGNYRLIAKDIKGNEYSCRFIIR